MFKISYGNSIVKNLEQMLRDVHDSEGLNN